MTKAQTIIKNGNLYNFDKDLNSINNLRITAEIIKQHNIKKNTPRYMELCYILEHSRSVDGDWLGYRYYLKLKENKFLIIYRECVFGKDIFVNIKFKNIKKYV